MKKELLYCVILVAVLFVLNIILHQIFVPQNATDLALQQMNEDGSREQLRVIERLSNYITPGLCVIGIVGILTIFYKSKQDPRKNIEEDDRIVDV